MDSIDLVSMIESLDDNIDDLEEALAPLLRAALSDTAGKLPVLDKAHLYVLVTYAIESMLFSYLRLNGVNAREHPAFRELARVKQYFEKIQNAESAGANPNAKLDKVAAGRFMKHALAGNEKYDLKRAEQQAKERAAAHVRFQEFSKHSEPELEPEVGPVSQAASSSSESESESVDSRRSYLAEQTEEVPNKNAPPVVKVKKGRKRRKQSTGSGVAHGTNISADKRKKERRARKKQKTVKQT